MMTDGKKLDMASFSKSELSALFTGMGLPSYRALQVFSWIHQKHVYDPLLMTDLPHKLRLQLADMIQPCSLTLIRKQCSSDGTVKYLFGLGDGNSIETVRMSYHHGNSVCISTQAGCRMGCTFCASTVGGLIRNLTPFEMASQIYAAADDEGAGVSSVVLMGIGEPLDNFDNVMHFLDIITDPDGLGMGMRHISLSTCGLCDKIDLLAERRLQLTLSVSLHAPDDETRDMIMPVNKKYPTDQLISCCRRYFNNTGRRISFEYALIRGVNDSDQHAEKLSRLLAGFNAHVNLIPVNPVREAGNLRPDPRDIRRFCRILTDNHINATIRRELGSDIDAACGQLRRKNAVNNGSEPGGRI